MASHYHKEGRYREADVHLQILLEQTEESGRVRANLNETGLYQLACYNDMALTKYREAVLLAKDIIVEKLLVGSNPGIRDCLGRAYEALQEYQLALQTYLAILPGMTGEPPPGLSLALART